MCNVFCCVQKLLQALTRKYAYLFNVHTPPCRLPSRQRSLEVIYLKNKENWWCAIILEGYSEHEQNSSWYIVISCWYRTTSNNLDINTNYAIAANYLKYFISIFRWSIYVERSSKAMTFPHNKNHTLHHTRPTSTFSDVAKMDTVYV